MNITPLADDIALHMQGVRVRTLNSPLNQLRRRVLVTEQLDKKKKNTTLSCKLHGLEPMWFELHVIIFSFEPMWFELNWITQLVKVKE